MRNSVTKEGRTLEEATEMALAELGVSGDAADIEVLDDGKSGFLGFGGRNAKVRVSLKKTTVHGEDSKMAPPVTQKQGPGEGSEDETHGREEQKTEADHAVDPETVRELLSGLITRMHMEGAIEIRTREGRLIANVVGKDSNLLIGKRGQTLDAIQFLTNLMYSKTMKKRGNLVVDVEEYKVRREKRLWSMALDARDKVMQSQKPVAIAPMNAQDRRIIHLALQDDDSVKTVSRGEGLLRKVVVIPKSAGS